MQVKALPLFEDNYAWLIHNHTHGWIIDPGQAAPVVNLAKQLNITLAGMLITHRHWDHVGGINELSQQMNIPVYGPANTHQGINKPLSEGSTLNLASMPLEVWHTPGHTSEHLSYFAPRQGWLFCGDTIFSAGCGRVKSSGNVVQLFHSIKRIRQLPEDTLLFCSHEYTLANLAFAATIEPTNATIAQLHHKVTQLHQQGLPSLPTTLATELACNPFLRLQQAAVIQHTKLSAPAPLDVFTALRKEKDSFRT